MNQTLKEEDKITKEDNIEKNKVNDNNPKNKKQKKKSKLKKVLIGLTIFIVLAIGSFGFLLYGPYDGFRNWLITTAMTTMTHQWIAYLFYDDETIAEVMANNRVDEIQEDTNVDEIGIATEPQYANEYEKQILEKDPGNEDYKIVDIEGNGYSGYLAAVYNPSKIHTLVTAKVGKVGQYLTTMAKDKKAKLAINGGGFDDPNFNSNGAHPLGVTYVDGKQVTAESYSGPGGLIGFDNNDKLILSSNCTASFAESAGIRDCVTCGPFLIVNGKASTVVGNGGWGTAPRTAIGQRQDGIVLFLVLDGRTVKKPGADMDDLIEIMQRYGAYNASNLDGGTSSVMVKYYKIINDPIDSTGAHKTRFIPTGFGIID